MVVIMRPLTLERSAGIAAGRRRLRRKTTVSICRPFPMLMQLRTWRSRRSSGDVDPCSAGWRLMEVRYDLPDFRRCMLAAERRSGNQIFAHRQSADDDRVETNLSDEG